MSVNIIGNLYNILTRYNLSVTENENIGEKGNKSDSEKLDISLLNEENWRGKGNNELLKKKRPSKCLDPCPEIKKVLNK